MTDLYDGFTQQEIDLLKQSLAVLAQDDSPDGFEAYFELVFEKRLTKFARKWVNNAYSAREQGKNYADEAFRGSAKTAVMTIGFTSFRIGKEPHKSYLLIQVGDDIAKDNTGQIADIIENNPGWKLVYPNVVPDKDRGWSEKGYEVKDTSMTYGEWRQKNATRKDPSFAGYGYTSHSIIGKRPTGMLVIDDILDEKNTSSDTLMEEVRKILRSTIFPTIVPGTLVVLVFTPWRDNDPIVELSNTSLFIHDKTPAYVEASDGIEFSEINANVIPTWKKERGIQFLKDQFELSGTVDFARMFALDLTKTNNQEFRFYDYPAHLVKFDWAMVGGADYASSLRNYNGATADTDMYALAYVAKLPEGGAVVVGGEIDRGTLLNAMHYAQRAQEIFPSWMHTVVESDGKGTEFLQSMWMQMPDVRLIPSNTGGRNKIVRLRTMAPWFENGRVRISDANTPFLIELRKELRQFPLCKHDDAMDAVYWALTGVIDALQMPKQGSELPSTKHQTKTNPWAAFGRR